MENRIPFVLRPYRRAWWLPGAHLQTLGGWLLRSRSGVRFHRERVETPDGDFLDLDYAEVGALSWAARQPSDPIALVIHGLEGSSTALPVLESARALAAQGIRSVALNFRSCSGAPNRTGRFYHAGETSDLGFVVDLLVRRYPSAPFGVMAYSLGGNVLLKYLGEQGERARHRLRGAVAFSVPFDLSAGANKLECGAGPLYVAHFLRSLRGKYRQKAEVLGERCDYGRLAAARSFREFDDAITAPLHGFRDAEDYYTSSSSTQFLPHIRVPTLLLHAADDPFLPAEAVPHQHAAMNPSLVAGFTESGGHVGFIAGRRPWAPEFWAEREGARFLNAMLRASDAAPLTFVTS